MCVTGVRRTNNETKMNEFSESNLIRWRRYTLENRWAWCVYIYLFIFWRRSATKWLEITIRSYTNIVRKIEIKEINRLQREQTVLDDNTTSSVYFSRETDVRATTGYWRILTVDTKGKHGCNHMRSAASIASL